MTVALYARVSTAKQAEKDLSIPDQLKQMRDWCRGHGYAVALESVEAGASATGDRRPVFQQMIAEATREPAPFEAIIIHSLSRFFRDSLEFALYERKLNKTGVRVVSITQQTSDDPAGEMARRVFNIFDEYQSKENGKHTLRAMNENARQGFFNGSRPTFGYRLLETESPGNKGRKKRMEIDPIEAEIVRRIFAMYLDGHEGADLGCKHIATYWNERGLRMRRQAWTRARVHEVLTNRTYMGEYVFNKIGKDGRRKPEAEWIRVSVPPIVDAETPWPGAGARSRACAGQRAAASGEHAYAAYRASEVRSLWCRHDVDDRQGRPLSLLQVPVPDRKEQSRLRQSERAHGEARPAGPGSACGKGVCAAPGEGLALQAARCAQGVAFRRGRANPAALQGAEGVGASNRAAL